MRRSSKGNRTDDVRRRIAAIHGATSPPKEVLRQSMAKLHDQLSRHYRQQWALHAERDKYLLQLYAPVVGLVKTDKRAAAALRGWGQLTQRTLKRKPPASPRMRRAEPRIMPGSLYTFNTPPYLFGSPQGGGEALVAANNDGTLTFGIDGNGAGSWAWCGVCIPFVPDHDVYVRISPFVSYSYTWLCDGYILTAHTNGSIGTHVHQYDQNWNESQTPYLLPGGAWFSTTQIWRQGSTDDPNYDEGTGTYSGSGEGLLLPSGYNYLIWAWCAGNCDDSSRQLSGAFSVAHGQMSATVHWIVLELLA